MDSVDIAEAVERLEEIQEEMTDLLDEALDLIPEGITKDRAKAYWYGHIITNLGDQHMYASGSMCSMQDTINEMENGEEDEDEDE